MAPAPGGDGQPPALSSPAMAGLALVLAVFILAYALGYYHNQIDRHLLHGHDENKQKHSSRPSRPVPPLSMA